MTDLDLNKLKIDELFAIAEKEEFNQNLLETIFFRLNNKKKYDFFRKINNNILIKNTIYSLLVFSLSLEKAYKVSMFLPKFSDKYVTTSAADYLLENLEPDKMAKLFFSHPFDMKVLPYHIKERIDSIIYFNPNISDREKLHDKTNLLLAFPRSRICDKSKLENLFKTKNNFSKKDLNLIEQFKSKFDYHTNSYVMVPILRQIIKVGKLEKNIIINGLSATENFKIANIIRKIMDYSKKQFKVYDENITANSLKNINKLIIFLPNITIKTYSSHQPDLKFQDRLYNFLENLKSYGTRCRIIMTIEDRYIERRRLNDIFKDMYRYPLFSFLIQVSPLYRRCIDKLTKSKYYLSKALKKYNIHYQKIKLDTFKPLVDTALTIDGIKIRMEKLASYLNDPNNKYNLLKQGKYDINKNIHKTLLKYSDLTKHNIHYVVRHLNNIKFHIKHSSFLNKHIKKLLEFIKRPEKIKRYFDDHNLLCFYYWIKYLISKIDKKNNKYKNKLQNIIDSINNKDQNREFSLFRYFKLPNEKDVRYMLKKVIKYLQNPPPKFSIDEEILEKNLGNTILGFIIEDHSKRDKFIDDLYQKIYETDYNIQKKAKKHGVITISKNMLKMLRKAEKYSKSDVAVTLQGESGVGKNLIAKFIHEMSNRTGDFVEINCAGISETLFNSELFGHKKGAFTGAIGNKIGRLKKADHGTLYLDEINGMSPANQKKILHYFNEKKFKRVGGTKDIEVDTRIIAASNESLDKLIKKGRFRKDLSSRIGAHDPLTIPPLRERPIDIPVLAKYFFTSLLKKNYPINSNSIKYKNGKFYDYFKNNYNRGNIRDLKRDVELDASIAIHEGNYDTYLDEGSVAKLNYIDKTKEIKFDDNDKKVIEFYIHAKGNKKEVDDDDKYEKGYKTYLKDLVNVYIKIYCKFYPKDDDYDEFYKLIKKHFLPKQDKKKQGSKKKKKDEEQYKEFITGKLKNDFKKQINKLINEHIIDGEPNPEKQHLKKRKELLKKLDKKNELFPELMSF